MRAAVTALLFLAVLFAATPAMHAAVPGTWERVDLAGGSHSWIYLPVALAGEPGLHPAVAFLHGAGADPVGYRATVRTAAEAAGLVAVLPRSSSAFGWGVAGDRAIVEAALAAAGADPARTTLAGHSAGGAYAYLLTYAGAYPARAAFSLGAPFYPVAELSLAAPGRVPPIHMYYGASDAHETGGSHAALRAQWARLGVAQSSDVRSGYGHNSWPQDALDAGFLFLAEASQPGGCAASPPTVLCLHGGRFLAEVEWRDHQGGSGDGRVVDAAASETSGLFWFFNPANWELMVKVLDGCAVNGHRWVFAAATTDVAYTLTVTDTEGGGSWSFDNPAGRPAPAVTDTTAFAACP